ncbi:MAG: lmo0937 family membrane protein [Ferruginibacter sp.]
MGNILYAVAVICVIIWAISFLGGFFTGGIIHILLVIAVIAIIYNLLTGRKAL